MFDHVTIQERRSLGYLFGSFGVQVVDWAEGRRIQKHQVLPLLLLLVVKHSNCHLLWIREFGGHLQLLKDLVIFFR